jgi:hypothetical protein
MLDEPKVRWAIGSAFLAGEQVPSGLALSRQGVGGMDIRQPSIDTWVGMTANLAPLTVL